MLPHPLARVLPVRGQLAQERDLAGRDEEPGAARAWFGFARSHFGCRITLTLRAEYEN